MSYVFPDKPAAAPPAPETPAPAAAPSSAITPDTLAEFVAPIRDALEHALAELKDLRGRVSALERDKPKPPPAKKR